MRRLPTNLGRSILKNAASQMAGRIFLSISRLGVAAIIVRNAGAERFGEYSLLLSMILVAEWMVDFGATDIAVRAVCRRPDRMGGLLASLMGVKLLQALAVFGLFAGALYVLDYSPEIVRAGLVGGLGLFFYSGVLIWRTLFRCRMSMEKDVGGEIVGIVVMIPLVWWASAADASIVTLTGCYTISRAVFFVAVVVFGLRQMPLRIADIFSREGWALVAAAIPLGIVGLMVCSYDMLAPVVLSKMASINDVANYACAMRFVFPAIIVIQAISGTVYTPLATHWKHSMADFKKIQQNSLEAAVLISGAIFCALNVSAEWLTNLVGSEMAPAALILRLLSWGIIARTIATMMSPLVIVAGRQSQALWLTAVLLGGKVVAMLYFVPLYGALGAAMADVGVEVLMGMVPTVLVAQYLTGVWLQWKRVLLIVLAAFTALFLCELAGLMGTLPALAVLPAYLALAVLLGGVNPARLVQFARTVATRTPNPATPPAEKHTS